MNKPKEKLVRAAGVEPAARTTPKAGFPMNSTNPHNPTFVSEIESARNLPGKIPLTLVGLAPESRWTFFE